MISAKLEEMVIKEYLLPSEKLISYKFVRELNRKTQTYIFLLYLYVEDDRSNFCTERSIILGTSSRN